MYTSKLRAERAAVGTGHATVTIERVLDWIEDVREQYQREEEQAILQRNMDRAITALAGKEACQRLKNSLTMRHDMDTNLLSMTTKKARG